MSNENKRLKMKSRPCPWKIFAFLAFFSMGAFVSAAFAQYSGGDQTTGDAESSIGNDIYNGGAQNNSPYSTSGSQGTLSYGTATQLSFTVSPSDTNHSFPFSRQPVVAVEDVNGNVVVSDNTDQVTVAILSNPGNGSLMGTATVTVVNGLAQFSNLAINAAGQLYTLQATATGLTSATSATFNINPGTGPKASAVWDNGALGYFVYVWAESDNAKEPFAASDNGATGDTCTITIYNPDGSVNSTLNSTSSPALTADNTKNWCVTSAIWNPATFNGSTLANGYTATVTINGATPCGTGGTSLGGSQVTGATCTATIPFPLSGSGTVIQDSFGTTINWEDIGVIKAKTDTINWSDIKDIKANTDGLNWYVTNTLQSTITNLNSFLDKTSGNGYGINWNNFAVQTNTGVNWNDIARLSVNGINWTDMSVLSNVGINWNDFNVLTKKGINWADVQKLYNMGVNWNDLYILGRAGINWSDLGISSKANINWYDMAVMSGVGINWGVGTSGINWYDFATLTHAGVNWSNLDVMSANNINWSDFGVLSKTGINWNDLTILTKAGINWSDFGVLGNTGINWTDLGVLSKTGINWNDFGVMSKTGINWNDLDVLTRTGINWTDFGVLSKTGINWTDFGVLSKTGINWNDLGVLTKTGINWTDFGVLSKTGINWNDFGVLSKTGINWNDFGVLSKTGINWNDLNVLSRTGINWNDFGVLSKSGINWTDFGALSKTGINWTDASFTQNRQIIPIYPYLSKYAEIIPINACPA